MINFEASNIEELEEEARERALEVSVEVVTAVTKALHTPPALATITVSFTLIP